ELSGPLVWAMAYNELKKFELEHTLQFYIGPENIGAVAYLAYPVSGTYNENGVLHSTTTIGDWLLWNLNAGYVVNCVGLGPEQTYKKSRRGNTLADRAAANVLYHVYNKFGREHFVKEMDFFPDGSDERQFCSPGYNLPIGVYMRKLGVYMRKPYWGYPEYHTSLDNKLDWDVMEESVKTLVDIVLTADRGDEVWQGVVQMGTPQFSKCNEDIYESTMKLNSFLRPDFNRKVLLDLCNFCDGEHSLLDIAERRGYKLLDILPMVDRLRKLDFIWRKR
ncbi:MAG: DUF4910 domain-containing protein, partial [Candidatus Thorarchaeota archaeon]